MHENERIRQKIPLLQQLPVPHCEYVDDAIYPGLTMVSWLSMNLQSYLDNVNQELQKLELTIDHASGLIEHRINVRLESIMLQNLPIMLFGISLIFCLLCLFLCFLHMDYADISCF